MDINNTKKKFRLKEQRSVQIISVCFCISITCMIIVLSAKILTAMNDKKPNQQTTTLESQTK